jgi:hypothetical protein
VSARLTLLAGIFLSTLSCGGDGVVSDMVAPPPDAPTLTELQTTIFSPQCGVVGCHGPPAPEQGMNLTAGNTYAFTVGVNSTELSGYKRVAPGNAADSYLYMKITGDPRIVGVRMPFGAAMLTPDELEAVRQWIEAGALDN